MELTPDAAKLIATHPLPAFVDARVVDCIPPLPTFAAQVGLVIRDHCAYKVVSALTVIAPPNAYGVPEPFADVFHPRNSKPVRVIDVLLGSVPPFVVEITLVGSDPVPLFALNKIAENPLGIPYRIMTTPEPPLPPVKPSYPPPPPPPVFAVPFAPAAEPLFPFAPCPPPPSPPAPVHPPGPPYQDAPPPPP